MACYNFRGKLSPFRAVRENNKIIVSNEFVRCVHDLDRGGEMIEAVIVNGSGKNLFTGAQNTVIGITQNSVYHLYRSSAAPVLDFSVTEEGENTVLKFIEVQKDRKSPKLQGCLDGTREFLPAFTAITYENIVFHRRQIIKFEPNLWIIPCRYKCT